MPKTRPADIARRMTQAFDPWYYASLYRQMNYTFGEPWNNELPLGTGSSIGGEFPDYADIVVRFLKVGQSRRILGTSLISLAKVMYEDPAPEFPDLDPFIGEVRKQYFVRRWQGLGGVDGSWQDEMASVFMEGDGLGIGYAQVGLRTNPDTGKQYTDVRHSPTILTLRDRYTRNPAKANWIAFCHYYSPEDAKDLFGSDVVKKYKYQLYDSFQSHYMDVVRMFEYYDLGFGAKGTPTRAIIPKNLNDEPISIEENPFGQFLPVAHYMFCLLPGMRYPAGRIAFQQSSQEMLNQIETYLRSVLKSPGFSIVDVTQLNVDDLRRVEHGDTSVMVRLENPRKDAPAFVRVASAEIAASLSQLRQMFENQFTSDSGQTEFDRGVNPGVNRTLGENQLVDSRGQVNSSWSDRQAVKMYERLVQSVMHVGQMKDKDPLTLNIFGHRIKFNDPTNPNLDIASFLKDESKIVISEEQLRKSDVKADQMANLQAYDSPVVMALLQAGQFDATEFAELVAKSLPGVEDPKKLLAGGGNMQAAQQQAPMGQPAPMGMPGPGAAPMMPQPGMAPQPGIPGAPPR